LGAARENSLRRLGQSSLSSADLLGPRSRALRNSAPHRIFMSRASTCHALSSPAALVEPALKQGNRAREAERRRSEKLLDER